ncbi:hypothetical protein AMR42_00045 [Limnothrix sp. PR1529]|uniref:hypothetical protein n=1 Tax=Limnothrix sp. PR1529 TaxID=1704291 RepID=UPI00081EF742|nr:hypothetical protein [Limnothrix sp. PR1529]OCQ94063.1 hypothetical protein BCR12_05980 [Limnothrix sp. P13C2]PIB15778.1 hypothetical protein AMR42_00045 [Limnothrix sp. PR1529]
MAKTDATDLALAELGVGTSEPPKPGLKDRVVDQIEECLDALDELADAVNPDVLDSGDQVVKLPSGRVAKIREGTMADLERAQLLSGGKQQKLIPFLIAELVEIDGEKLTYEKYRALPIREGSVLMTAVAAQFPEGES